MDEKAVYDKLLSAFRHEIVNFTPEDGGFMTTIRCNCSSEADIAGWVGEYEQKWFTSWICKKKENFENRKVKKLELRRDYECRLSNRQHVKYDGPRCLARGCEASLIFKLKVDSKYTRDTDPYVKVSGF